MAGPTLHSRIGASSMYRWKECPGSVQKSEGIESSKSIYAELGTNAHEVASELLLGNSDKAYDLLFQFCPTIEERNNMMAAVGEYVKICSTIKNKSPNSQILVEHKFDLTKIHPNLFGTADCIIFNPDEKTLYVIDYKHGEGKAVEADDNDQLKYYGLGALMTAGFVAETIVLVIVQPRCYHVKGPDRRYSFPSIDILDFAADLKKFAVATEQKDAPLKAGDHCQFCPASAICEERNKVAREVMKNNFLPVEKGAAPPPYDPEQLSQTLDQIDAIESWCKAVRGFAYAEAQSGRMPPNYKLVQKRSMRRWRNEGDVTDLAKMLDREDFFNPPSLKTPPAVEEILGKKEFKKLLETHVISESSGTTLVHVSDKREAVTGSMAAKYFEIETTQAPNIFE